MILKEKKIFRKKFIVTEYAALNKMCLKYVSQYKTDR